MNRFTIKSNSFEWHLFSNLGVLYSSFDHDIFTFKLWNYGDLHEINLFDKRFNHTYVISWYKNEFVLRDILKDIAKDMLEQRGVLEYEHE